MTVTKWLVYTVSVGLIPIAARLLVWLLSPTAGSEFMWSATDLAAFGLVLNITNINALEHNQYAKEWKTRANGLSLLHIVFFGALFTAAFLAELHPDLIFGQRLKLAAFVLCISSFALAYTVVDRLNVMATVGVAR